MISDETMSLSEAACYLNMSPEALRRKAKAGTIPGAKPAKEWVFIKEDLLAYIRSCYSSKVTVWSERSTEKEINQCHTNVKTECITPTLNPKVEDEYAKVLGLET